MTDPKTPWQFISEELLGEDGCYPDYSHVLDSAGYVVMRDNPRREGCPPTAEQMQHVVRCVNLCADLPAFLDELLEWSVSAVCAGLCGFKPEAKDEIVSNHVMVLKIKAMIERLKE